MRTANGETTGGRGSDFETGSDDFHRYRRKANGRKNTEEDVAGTNLTWKITIWTRDGPK